MREIFTVFNFTLKCELRKKSFRIATVAIIALIIIGSIIGSIAMSAAADKSKNETAELDADGKYDFRCYIIDENLNAANIANTLKTDFPKIEFVAGDITSEQNYRDETESAEIKTFITKINYATAGTDTNLLPAVSFAAAGGIFSSSPPYAAIAKVISDMYVRSLMNNAGIDEAVISAALTDAQYNVENIGGINISGYILGILVTVLIFMSIYYYGYFVAMSVASEKTSRVMETLIMSAHPKNILIGKCLAMGAAGLLQFALIIASAGLCYNFIFAPKLAEIGIEISLAGFGIGSILLIIVYFILGYGFFAMMNSVCGAGVSRAEDLNSALMPVMMISMVSFYAAYIGIFSAGDTVRRIMSFIPFTSAFIMPYRILNDSVPAMDIILSVLIMLAGIAIITVISVKLYTVSVLHYGQRLKIKDMWKMTM